VDDDIIEPEDHGEHSDEEHEEHPFFHPVAQETIAIDISDDDDDIIPHPPPRRRSHRELSPIVVTDDDGLFDTPPREWAAPGAIPHGTIEVMTDEDDEGEEEDVNWELQHSSLRGYPYDDDDVDDAIVPQYYDQDEDVVVPSSWVDEEESVGYYSDEY